MAAVLSSNRYAVVTGSNKGIGFEICRQLAAKGVTVVLTARDEKRGLEAVAKLKASSDFSGEHVLFHQLDVADPTSIASLADFIKTQFGKLDILVNNAGITGSILDYDTLKTLTGTDVSQLLHIKWEEIMKETYELAEECLKTNYYGAKKMIEAHIPLLELSDSPRIVNVSSSLGKLKNISNEWAKGVLYQTESLTEYKIDEVLNEYKKDFKEGSSRANKWPIAYILSKAAMNSYTRILAKKYPNFCINCVCPGFVKTDINMNTGTLTVEQGAEGPVKLALQSNGGPSGLFFSRTEESSFE